MNQTAIGSYIARKRKEQNLTQEQLAQQLGVSNKTISKWENGKCMPDYRIIQRLCEAIHVSLPELMDGEGASEDSVRVYDDEQILGLLRRTQELERQKGILCGFVLIVLGIASSALSRATGGTDVQNFFSGILMGLSVAEILAGIWTSAPEAVKNTAFFEPIIRFKEGGAFILFIALARPPAQAATPGACRSNALTNRERPENISQTVKRNGSDNSVNHWLKSRNNDMITVSTLSSSSQLEPISTPLVPAKTTISAMPAASMKMPSIKPTDSSLVLPAKFVLHHFLQNEHFGQKPFLTYFLLCGEI